MFIKKLKLLAVLVFEIFSIFRSFLQDSYYIFFIFLFYDYRVSLAPVACGALNLTVAAGGGKATISCPPRPTISDR